MTKKFKVDVTRSITCTVEVEADSPEAAVGIVNKRDFQLPPRDEWQGQKNWEYAVYDTDGHELLVTP